jgi:hypothetical protein
VIIRVCGDESGTHDGSDIMMLAGYVATVGQWNPFDIGWNRALKRVGLPYFHATEHLKTRAGAEFLPLAHKLTKKHLLFGYVIELDKESYENHYVAGERVKKPQLDTRYSVCFRYLSAFLYLQLPTLLGRDDFTIDFLLESGATGSADARRVLNDVKKQLPETREVLGTIDFGEKEKYPGLQVSDLMSFVALKLAPQNPAMVDLPPGKPLGDALASLSREEVLVIGTLLKHYERIAKVQPSAVGRDAWQATADELEQCGMHRMDIQATAQRAQRSGLIFQGQYGA